MWTNMRNVYIILDPSIFLAVHNEITDNQYNPDQLYADRVAVVTYYVVAILTRDRKWFNF